MTSFSSSGVHLYSSDRINALRNTLLPVPVDPAISRWGISARLVTRRRPLTSLPMARFNLAVELEKSGDSITSRSAIVSRLRLGTSIPTVDFPGMRSMSIDSACNARHRSSVSPVMREYLIPASGLNSKVVTTGPGLIWVTRPLTSNSWHFCSMARARSLSSSSSIFSARAGSRSRSTEGSRYPVWAFVILGSAAREEAAFLSAACSV